MKSSECPTCLKYGTAPRLFDDGRDCHHTCNACKYNDEHVEAGGIYYCPNPLCGICGASWIARGLEQTPVPGRPNAFTVDGDAIHEKQVAHVRALAISGSPADAKLLAFLRVKYPQWAADALGTAYVAICDRDLGDEDSP